MINPGEIAFIFQNTPDFKTGESRGYTIGYKPLPGAPKGTGIRKEVIADDVGESLAKVLHEQGKREYGGQLVTPKGDPLQTVMSTGIKIDQKMLDENVVKKPR